MITWVYGWSKHLNSTTKLMNEHKSVIVRKPWGYEYLAYQNASVALWVLHIQPGERTSMHCHPNKSTGLVVIDGEAEINFIADSRRVRAPGKQMIRRGLFHQTHAVSEHGVIMLEVESPVDKNDLIRLHDVYGRSDVGYEGAQFELPKDDLCLWIDNPTTEKVDYFVGSSLLTVEAVTTVNVLNEKNDSDIIMFLQGGLVKTVDGRTLMATVPGDVGLVQVVKQVAKEMDGFAPDTILMTIK